MRTSLVGLLLLLSPGTALAQGYRPVDPCKTDPPGEDCDTGSSEDGDDGDSSGGSDSSRRSGSSGDSGSDGSSGGGSSGASKAQDLMPPATDPMFFVGAIGPTFFGLNGARRGRRGATVTRGKLALELGYHLDGQFDGPALGASIEQTFSGDFYVLNPAFKFWWDIRPIEEYGIYITPFAKAGYALRTACAAPCPEHAANIGLGAEGRVVFKDQWIALIRPFQLDTYLGNFFEQTFWLNYSLLIGGGLTF